MNKNKTETSIRPKTKEFLDLITSNPKISHSKAYLQTHETENKNTAKVNASQLLSQPNIQLYLETHRNLAKRTQINVLKNATQKKYKEDIHWQRLASDQAEKILDRTDGRPLTKTNNVTLNISLESALNSLE